MKNTKTLDSFLDNITDKTVHKVLNSCILGTVVLLIISVVNCILS